MSLPLFRTQTTTIVMMGEVTIQGIFTLDLILQ
jgi:hypothetical protein